MFNSVSAALRLLLRNGDRPLTQPSLPPVGSLLMRPTQRFRLIDTAEQKSSKKLSALAFSWLAADRKQATFTLQVVIEAAYCKLL